MQQQPTAVVQQKELEAHRKSPFRFFLTHASWDRFDMHATA